MRTYALSGLLDGQIVQTLQNDHLRALQYGNDLYESPVQGDLTLQESEIAREWAFSVPFLGTPHDEDQVICHWRNALDKLATELNSLTDIAFTQIVSQVSVATQQKINDFAQSADSLLDIGNYAFEVLKIELFGDQNQGGSWRTQMMCKGSRRQWAESVER
ncbi:hypothetical protein L486_07643 [Kwoniella mangroviensis CBS 10435]|uniref:Uncharacterized protein n=1 Tax=Kwoniella mangroviensis CBS 10435 TaxID=1331196 RepID=A0A1B9IHR8_9TREE|nr:hypothetical protein L486_07643 [Kwoniella mangroviensis CBS 10435]